jgi:hypothetical protein
MRLKEFLEKQFIEAISEDERLEVIQQLTDYSDHWLMCQSDMLFTGGSIIHHVFIQECRGGGFEGCVYRGFGTVDPIMRTGHIIDVEEIAGLWQQIMDNPEKSQEIVVNREC